MYNIRFYNDSNGELQFESSNKNGRLVDITEETRAKAISCRRLLKKGQHIKNNLYLCRSDMIMDLTKKEDEDVDALLYTYKDKHLIIVPKGCIATFNI